MEEVIIIKNLNLDSIFNSLNMIIKNNRFISISGPNSSGKTTLLKVLNREIIVDNNILINNKYINDYKIDEYVEIIQCLIPLEIKFQEITPYEELKLYSNNNNEIEEVIKKLKLIRVLNKKVNLLTHKEIIKLQLALIFLQKPQIILIDAITSFFRENEVEELLKIIKEYQIKNQTTVIYTTIDLKETLLTDYLYIIDNGSVVLEGEPIKVLEKDNTINKIGLNIPFMIDLSVKLRDYDLIKEIELDKNRMIEKLWK